MMYTIIHQRMEQLADTKRAKKMEAYMKNKFIFYGIPTPQRRKLETDVLREIYKAKRLDWNELEPFYQDPHREMQYVACDIIVKMKSFLKPSDLINIQRYILTKSWWDTVDMLDEAIGALIKQYPELKKDMLKWAQSDSIWLQRVAIDHQLMYKDDTDCELLEQIICSCIPSSEFFVNKAIGWALRQYSKTNPKWVACFIQTHENQLAALSIREGSKYLKGYTN